MDIREVAAALTAIADSDVRGVVNVGTGSAIAVGDLARLTGRLLGREDLLVFGARGAGGDDASAMTASIERLRDEVGFSPSRTMEQSLQETIEWWRQELGNELASRGMS